MTITGIQGLTIWLKDSKSWGVGEMQNTIIGSKYNIGAPKI